MSHSPARPRAIGAALAAGALTLGVTAAGAPAVADTDVEAELLRLVNAERAEAGLPPVTLDPELTAGAEAWSAQLASSGGLAHDTFEVAGATAWAENVGRASVEDAAARLHEMLMASPQHGANILDPSWTVAGIGVTVVDGTVWMTQRFADASITATDLPAVETVLPPSEPEPATDSAPEPALEPPAAPAPEPLPQPAAEPQQVSAQGPPPDALPGDPPPAPPAAEPQPMAAQEPPPPAAHEPPPAPATVNPGRSGTTPAAEHRQGPKAEPGSRARGNAHGHDRAGGSGGNRGSAGKGRP